MKKFVFDGSEDFLELAQVASPQQVLKISAWAEGNSEMTIMEMTGACLLSLNVKGKLRRILDRIYNDLQRFYCTTWKTSWRKRCWCRKRSSCLCAHCFIVSLNDIIARCLTPSTNKKDCGYTVFCHTVWPSMFLRGLFPSCCFLLWW